MRVKFCKNNLHPLSDMNFETKSKVGDDTFSLITTWVNRLINLLLSKTPCKFLKNEKRLSRLLTNCYL